MPIRKKINNPIERPTILIAPLDWGLGHVTRCVPIIKLLERQNCKLIVAANGDVFSLLKKEFPSMVILRLSGYKIRYSRNKKLLLFKLLLQLPKLAISIYKENTWIKKIIRNYKPNVIISDNRFGMYNKDVISIYITHQLAIKTGDFVLDKIVNAMHNNFIKKYDQCWVPDFKEDGLAGDLSHPKKPQPNIIYLGALSRFENILPREKTYDLLVSISGPEPQRTIFENVVFYQLKNIKKRVLIVRGLPGENKDFKTFNPFVEIVNHLPAADLNKVFLESGIVICRSGYTTIMDLIKINKKAILVPTPGQTEQEYLADYLMKKKYFFSVPQEEFLLQEVLLKAEVFPFTQHHDNMENYKKIISHFVLSVKSGDFDANNFSGSKVVNPLAE